MNKLFPAKPPELISSIPNSVLSALIKLIKKRVSGKIDIQLERILFKKFKRSEKSFDEDEKN